MPSQSIDLQDFSQDHAAVDSAGVPLFFSRLTGLLTASMTGVLKYRRMEALNSLTDTELEALGLERDGLTEHVFGEIRDT